MMESRKTDGGSEMEFTTVQATARHAFEDGLFIGRTDVTIRESIYWRDDYGVPHHRAGKVLARYQLTRDADGGTIISDRKGIEIRRTSVCIDSAITELLRQ